MFTMLAIACSEAHGIGILYCMCAVFSGVCHKRHTEKNSFHFHLQLTGYVTQFSNLDLTFCDVTQNASAVQNLLSVWGKHLTSCRLPLRVASP